MNRSFVSIWMNIRITEEFFGFCQEHIGKSKRYLSNDIYQGAYNAKWKMIVPGTKTYQKNGGEETDDRI